MFIFFLFFSFNFIYMLVFTYINFLYFIYFHLRYFPLQFFNIPFFRLCNSVFHIFNDAVSQLFRLNFKSLVVGIHGSSQNLMFSPLPTSQMIHFSITSLHFIILLQEVLFLHLAFLKSLFGKYIDFNNFT